MKKIKSICFIIFILSFVLITTSWADKIAPNKEYKEYSENKEYFIEMIPSESYEDIGQGKVCEVRKDENKLLWEVDWYARKVLLLNDGKRLIRLGPWASKKDLSDLAIAFYNKGKLIKEYKVSDLLEDENSIKKTASHYFWRSKIQSMPFGFVNKERKFVLTTIENETIIFNTKTGEIIE